VLRHSSRPGLLCDTSPQRKKGEPRFLGELLTNPASAGRICGRRAQLRLRPLLAPWASVAQPEQQAVTERWERLLPTGLPTQCTGPRCDYTGGLSLQSTSPPRQLSRSPRRRLWSALPLLAAGALAGIPAGACAGVTALAASASLGARALRRGGVRDQGVGKQERDQHQSRVHGTKLQTREHL
jgi:hypothetical protein